MMQMKKITLDRSTIHGAISLEVQGGKIKPWRIPYEEKDLYYPNGLDGKAEMPAGVRISFISNTTKFELQYESNADLLQFDVLIDGQLYHTYELGYGQSSLTVTDMSSEPKKIDIYLFQRRVLSLKHLWIERAANWEPYTSNQKKWITYGSSITQCGEAESPSQTWPVITAKNLDLDLTCLGFGGQCHFEPMLARLIRDTPADFISLCAGINSYGSGTYNKRSFIPTLVGFIRILREKHHQIPIVLMSPIFGVEK